MRKHSARKWVHFILDLLPIFIIPIFGLYLINHEPQNLQIETIENIEVQYSQIRGDIVDNTRDINGVTVTSSNGALSFDGSVNYTGGRTSFSGYFTPYYFNIISGHYYYLQYSDIPLNAVPYITSASSSSITFSIGSPRTASFSGNAFLGFNFINVGTEYTDFTFSFNLFDLTSMFGVGNEPSIADFDLMFPFEYRETQIEPILMYLEGSVVENSSTDIGSQFIYSMYIPVRDYFNFNNVFNFGAIYNWFEVSLFSGNAPMSFFIVWNIILYEFVMDLVFLIYGLFMWFIDMCEKLMEKPLNSIK